MVVLIRNQRAALSVANVIQIIVFQILITLKHYMVNGLENLSNAKGITLSKSTWPDTCHRIS